MSSSSTAILLLPDDRACNPRNTFPGTVYNNADSALDMYGDNIDVDYRESEVTVKEFIRPLTDRPGEDVVRGERLGSDARTVHGGMKF